jgi:hypothetical protein
MIIIKSKEGVAIPDHKCFDVIKEAYLKNEDLNISSENIISAARVLAKRGVIPYKELIFKFNIDGFDYIIVCDKYGNLNDYPIGFDDFIEGCLEELVGF